MCLAPGKVGGCEGQCVPVPLGGTCNLQGRGPCGHSTNVAALSPGVARRGRLLPSHVPQATRGRPPRVSRCCLLRAPQAASAAESPFSLPSLSCPSPAAESERTALTGTPSAMTLSGPLVAGPESGCGVGAPGPTQQLRELGLPVSSLLFTLKRVRPEAPPPGRLCDQVG